MNAILTVFAAIAILTSALLLTNNAVAEQTVKDPVKEIMSNYKKAVDKAQSDFNAAIKKANADAKAKVVKKLPIDKINSESKAAIAKARADLKAARDAAQKEAASKLKEYKSQMKQ